MDPIFVIAYFVSMSVAAGYLARYIDPEHWVSYGFLVGAVSALLAARYF